MLKSLEEVKEWAKDKNNDEVLDMLYQWVKQCVIDRRIFRQAMYFFFINSDNR